MSDDRKDFLGVSGRNFDNLAHERAGSARQHRRSRIQSGGSDKIRALALLLARTAIGSDPASQRHALPPIGENTRRCCASGPERSGFLAPLACCPAATRALLQIR